MKLSILSGVTLTAGDLDGFRSMEESLRILCEAGFDTVDITFTEHWAEDYVLRREDWQQQIESLAEFGAKYGVTFAQSHLPTPRKASMDLEPNWKKPGYPAYFDECMRRAYAASGILGIPYGTVHPLTYLDAVGDIQKQKERNLAYYRPMIEWGAEHGVGTAFENMRPDSPDWGFTARYCQNYEHLIDLADSFHHPMVGICWDTGHANQAMQNQGDALRKIGSRLKNLHFNDNFMGCRDEHLLPFMGEVDWEAVLEALVDIDYQGVLNYEVGPVLKKAPAKLQQRLLPYVRENGRAMVELYEQIRQRKERA